MSFHRVGTDQEGQDTVAKIIADMLRMPVDKLDAAAIAESIERRTKESRERTAKQAEREQTMQQRSGSRLKQFDGRLQGGRDRRCCHGSVSRECEGT